MSHSDQGGREGPCPTRPRPRPRRPIHRISPGLVARPLQQVPSPVGLNKEHQGPPSPWALSLFGARGLCSIQVRTTAPQRRNAGLHLLRPVLPLSTSKKNPLASSGCRRRQCGEEARPQARGEGGDSRSHRSTRDGGQKPRTAKWQQSYEDGLRIMARALGSLPSTITFPARHRSKSAHGKGPVDIVLNFRPSQALYFTTPRPKSSYPCRPSILPGRGSQGRPDEECS